MSSLDHPGIPFTVVGKTSTDLEEQNKLVGPKLNYLEGSGWITRAGQSFPQEITLKLPGTYDIQRVVITTHPVLTRKTILELI